MQISLDSTYLLSLVNIFQHNPFYVLGILIYKGGWLLCLVSLAWGLYFAHFEKKKRDFINNNDYSMIAIDVPKTMSKI